MVCASAPGKLMLFGEHSVVYGDPCIVTAVDQRIMACVEKNGEGVFHMEAPDLGLEVYTKKLEDLGKKELPKAVRFIEMLYKRFLEVHPQTRGIVVRTKSEFSCSFGFGSSSAVTVAFAKALYTLYEIKVDEKQLFDLCYKAVIDVQGVGSGFDLAAAIWGGTLYYIPPAKVVEKINIDELPLVVGYTGVKADTPTIVRMVAAKKGKNPEKVESLFDEITEIVEIARKAIEKGDWEKVGGLMNQNQALLARLGVSSVELDSLIGGSRDVGGALGAKLSGAGGGDCMLALAKNSEREEGQKEEIEKAIKEKGGEVMRVGLNAEGVRLEK